MVTLPVGCGVGVSVVGSVGCVVGVAVVSVVAKTAKMSVVTSWKKRKTHCRNMYHRYEVLRIPL